MSTIKKFVCALALAAFPLFGATVATDSNFNDIVSKGVTAVDFYADWCAPCKKFGPTFDKVAQGFDGKAQFIKVNIDNARKVADQYKVRSIPTVIYFKNGKEVDRQEGAPSEGALRDRVQKLLN